MTKFYDEKVSAVREQESFVPAYSAYRYEKKKHILSVLSILMIYVDLIMVALFIIWIEEGLVVFGLFMVAMAVIFTFYCAGGFHLFDQEKWKCGYLLTPEGIQYLNAAKGVRRNIRYDDLRMQIQNGAICYKTDALILGKGKNRIVFPYEIGQSKERKHNATTYKLLEKYLGVKLPTYKKSDMDLLDRKYFYEKSQFKHCLSLLAAIFTSWFVLNTFDTNVGIYVACGICGLWESFSLSRLHLAAVYGVKNQKKIREVFQDIPHPMQFGFMYRQVVVFIMAVVVMLFCNLKLSGLV